MKFKIDYNEMSQWVNNDEYLYNWWLSTKLCISTFIRINNKELRKFIKQAIS